MKTLGITAFFLGLLALMPHAVATSRIYSNLDQLIASSDVIAVVYIDKSNQESRIKRTATQSFGCATAAQTQKILKGTMPESFLVHHASGRDDALFQQGPGVYLVFLKLRDGKYVPTDGWPSSKPIREGYVIGWSDSHSWRVKGSQENALKQLQQTITKK